MCEFYLWHYFQHLLLTKLKFSTFTFRIVRIKKKTEKRGDTFVKRSSGILMHISSLPSTYGIGTLGKEAYKFADFLKKSGQSHWQVLPLGPTGFGDSPYQSFSTFAGNPYFIDLEMLCESGFLEKSDIESCNWGEDPESVDYGMLYENRYKVLRIAFQNARRKDDQNKEGIDSFIGENHMWVFDYGIFMAVKEHFGNVEWMAWPDEKIKGRDPERMGYYWHLLKEEIEFWVFIQYLFFQQWHALKDYVNGLGIKIIGDLPIYVAMDSVDIWSNVNLFSMDGIEKPSLIAGCPPDYFSKDGQLWGNPIYQWEEHKKEGYGWWLERLEKNLSLFDILRIDHFRGFDSYYAITFGESTARNGVWERGPGMDFISLMKDQLKEGSIIAEDLGLMTDGVKQLLADSGFPGMSVLQFAFSSNVPSDYLPHKHKYNSVTYTGTHDNATIMDFYAEMPKKDQTYAKAYLSLKEADGINWGFIRGAFASVANLAIIPIQDYLGLGKWARMNEPSTLGGNWVWRLKSGVLTEELTHQISELTKLYERSL